MTGKQLPITLAAIVVLSAVLAPLAVGTAAAAGSTDVELAPATATVDGGNTTTFDLVVTNASGGIGAYDFTVSTDASVAEITAVEFRAGSITDKNISADGSSATFKAFGGDTNDTGSVTVATITVEGASAGSAAVDVTVNTLGDEEGHAYTVNEVRGADLTVEGDTGGSTSVELANAQVSPSTVDEETTVNHQLTFDALGVSDDGQADTFTVTLPDAVTLESVNDVSVVDANGDTVSLSDGPTTNGNEITFGVSPDSSADARDLSVTADVNVSFPAVDSDTTKAIDVSASDSSNGNASASVDLTIQDTDTTTEPSGPTLDIEPSEQSVSTSGTVTYDIVLNEADGGVGAYDFTVSTDASVATITDIELGGDPGFPDVTYASDNSSVEVKAFGADTADTGPVTVATITVAGESEGDATLDLSVSALGKESGQPYNLSAVNDGTVSVTADPVSRFEVTDVSVPDVVVGNNVTAAATVRNTGDAAGSQTVEFTLGGEVRASETVSLDGGESTQVSFTVDTTGDDAGTYQFGVQTDDDTTTGQIELFAASTTFSDTEVDYGDANVTVDSANYTGGEYYVVLHVKENGSVSSPVAASGALSSGLNENVTVELDSLSGDALDRFTENATLVAMLHEADNGSFGNAITRDGSAVTDDSMVTVDRPTVAGASGPATNGDGDVALEDVNGDGSVGVTDAQFIFVNFDEVQNTPNADIVFDFNGDGKFTISDAQALFMEVIFG